jgi:hypothetical protein
MKQIFMPTVAALLLIVIAVPQVAQADEPPDVVSPVAECVAVCDAGFFLISATDDVTPDESIDLRIIDTGTTTVFGPLSNPEQIKYFRSNRPPAMMAKNGSFFIFGSGPPHLLATDLWGNTHEVACQP